jgi:hypothetical protein
MDLLAFLLQRPIHDEIFRKRFTKAQDDAQQIIEIVSDSARKLTDGFHLLRLAQLLFQNLLVGNVLEDRNDAVLSGNFDDLRRIHPGPPCTRFRKERNFEITDRATLLEDPDKFGASFGVFPKFHFQGCAA